MNRRFLSFGNSSVSGSRRRAGGASACSSIDIMRARAAEGYFLKAIEIAQTQQAKSCELRTTTSLARLWQSQGKRQEDHQMLSAV
jgi:hypothetical protein